MRGWQGSNLGGPFCANTDRARRRHRRLREVAGRPPDFAAGFQRFHSPARRPAVARLSFLQPGLGGRRRRSSARRAKGPSPAVLSCRLPTEITTTLDFTPVVYQDYSDPSGFLHLTFNGDVRASTAGSPIRSSICFAIPAWPRRSVTGIPAPPGSRNETRRPAVAVYRYPCSMLGSSSRMVISLRRQTNSSVIQASM
jgi:hypothetical protein